MEIDLGNVGKLIELATTPSLLLIGVGTQLRVLTNRLARIVDRTLMLEERTTVVPEKREREYQEELDVLYRRKRAIFRAIGLNSACALLMMVVIFALFIDDVTNVGLSGFIALLFIAGMLGQIASFLWFLHEILISDQALYLTIRQSPPLRRRR
jgi:hypothetical protein